MDSECLLQTRWIVCLFPSDENPSEHVYLITSTTIWIKGRQEGSGRTPERKESLQGTRRLLIEMLAELLWFTFESLLLFGLRRFSEGKWSWKIRIDFVYFKYDNDVDIENFGLWKKFAMKFIKCFNVLLYESLSNFGLWKSYLLDCAKLEVCENFVQSGR